MGSGKSTFSKELTKKLQDHIYICLDDHRKRKFADVLTEQHDPLQFERDVSKATEREIAKHKRIIYETTGATRFFKDIHYQLTAARYKIFIIAIKCAPEICLERHLDREKAGHFHVVPQYGKGLSPEELINRHEEKTKWIRPDLVLDSSKFPVEKLINQFLRAYYPSGETRDIQEILRDFNYEEALAWFKENVSGKIFIKEMLSSGEDDFNRLKLKKELNSHLVAVEHTPKKVYESSSKSIPPVNNQEEPTVRITAKERINPSTDPLKEEWAPLYKEANFLFIELEHEKDDDKREQMTFRILDLMDQVQGLWDKSDFIKQHGHAPNFNSAGIDDLSEAQKSKRINTLRTYISKAKKGKLKAERIPEWESEKQELENNLS